MSDRPAFEARVLPHLDAAYNLARWLMRNDQAAEDAVQEATLRALRYLGALRDGDARPWLLGIVRNTCFTMLEHQRKEADRVDFDEADYEAAMGAAEGTDPEARWQARSQRAQIDAAIQALAPALREVIVLRELEELDYAQIASITAVPIGTVMSRLSRARAKLREALAHTRLSE